MAFREKRKVSKPEDKKIKKTKRKKEQPKKSRLRTKSLRSLSAPGCYQLI